MNNSLNISSNNDTSLTVFQKFENKSVDCFEKDNNVWFRLSDIAKVLEVGRSTASMWKEMADEDELVFKKVEHSKEPAPYGSESLLYRILNRSNSPKAKPFERWVTKEVIPAIRKNGGYIVDQENLSDDELIAKALVVAQRIIAKKDEAIAQMQPKAIYYDNYMDSSNLIEIGHLGKTTKIGEQKIFKTLLNGGYIKVRYSTDGIKYYDSCYGYEKYFKSIPITFTSGEKTYCRDKLMLTSEGFAYFMRKLA